MRQTDKETHAHERGDIRQRKRPTRQPIQAGAPKRCRRGEVSHSIPRPFGGVAVVRLTARPIENAFSTALERSVCRLDDGPGEAAARERRRASSKQKKPDSSLLAAAATIISSRGGGRLHHDPRHTHSTTHSPGQIRRRSDDRWCCLIADITTAKKTSIPDRGEEKQFFGELPPSLPGKRVSE